VSAVACAAHPDPWALFIGPAGERPAAREAREREALTWCAQCTPRCRAACLDVALDSGDEEAVMGGTTPSERRWTRRAVAA